MNNIIKKIKLIFIILFSIIFFIFSDMILTQFDEYDETSSDYYINCSYSETESKNYVTAIYLDYRLFDSIFEAATLFVVAAGILFLGFYEGNGGGF